MTPLHWSNKLFSFISILLFLTGMLSIMAISVGVLWSELEANIYFTQRSGGNLKLSCPLVLSPTETGLIRATVTNTIDENVKPVVTARISREHGTQDTQQVLNLIPGQSQTLEWQVNRANIIFNRLVLVNIDQWRYSKFDDNQGTCGILILGIFGLTGLWSLGLILVVSLLLSVVGAMLWLRYYSRDSKNSVEIIQIGKVFTGLVSAGMLAAVFRWWGLILVFDAIALITIPIAFTEIAFSGNE